MNGKFLKEFKGNVIRSLQKDEPTLSGLRMAGLKITVTYEEGRGNWRAFCIRCGGAGRFDNMTAGEVGFTPVQDRDGRGEICFLCNGAQKFLLPSPTLYGELIRKVVSQGDRGENLVVYESELDWYMKLCDEVGPENCLWQAEVMNIWHEAMSC